MFQKWKIIIKNGLKSVIIGLISIQKKSSAIQFSEGDSPPLKFRILNSSFSTMIQAYTSYLSTTFDFLQGSCYASSTLSVKITFVDEKKLLSMKKTIVDQKNIFVDEI